VDLLRSRLAAALVGTASVLSSLITKESAQELQLDPGQALEALKSTADSAKQSTKIDDALLQKFRTASERFRKSAARRATGENVELPDLTEIIKQQGTYDKYSKWREDYKKWRSGGAQGSKGELTVQGIGLHQSTETSVQRPTVKDRVSMPHLEDETEEGDLCTSEAAPAACLPVQLDARVACQIPNLAALINSEAPSQAPLLVIVEDSLPTVGAEPLATPATVIRSPAVFALVQDAQDTFQGEELNPKMPEVPLVSSLSPRLTKLARKATRKFTVTEKVETAELSHIHVVQSSSAASASHVSLNYIQSLLVEIEAALAPVNSLVHQAEQRFDGKNINPSGWRFLASALGMVRLRLSLLARLALAQGEGLSVAPLLGGHTGAATRLVSSFAAALAAATQAVAGGTAPPPSVVAKLENDLRVSATALGSALEQVQPVSKMDDDSVASEVLTGTVCHSLAALLHDAGEVLSWAVVLAGSHETPTLTPDEGVRDKARVPLNGGVDIGLPDLTERLKEDGTYDEYLKWREGYMKWRTGHCKGAHGEVVSGTTT